MTLKTRELPLYDFFTKLQEEYVCAELRYKIYPRTRDKDYYKNRVMEGKKKIIDDISFRNGLPSIFNSEAQKQKIYSRVYVTESGFPNFIYKDECERNSLSYNDKIHYYTLETEVKVTIPQSEVKIGKLKSINTQDHICSVQIDDVVEVFALNQIARIL